MMKTRKISVVLSIACIVCFGMAINSVFAKDFMILSGSENKSLEPILQKFGQQHGVNVVMTYKGSIDIMHILSKQEIAYDAVWPANSLWISLGDTHRRVKHDRSIMTSPVVFGIRKSLAEQLGFMGKNVMVKDILGAIQQQQFRFMMTSATQSNSGASAYFGFLYALLGNPDVLTLDHLQQPQLKQDIQQLFSGIHRSSGSSGWLKDLFVKGDYDAMVNYEAMMIEANQELLKQGKEPLYVVYPVDGIVFSDSPLGYINRGDKDREVIFQRLQEYLLSDDVQSRILRSGRRTGFGGIMEEVDSQVFNPDWGIDVNKILSPITLPAANVIHAALNTYQSQFRKPSLTIFCLDFSGSMEGEGETQLKKAMTLLLEQDQAKEYLIHASEGDVHIVIPFHKAPIDMWEARGNDPQELQRLLNTILTFAPGGGTDIYQPATKGLNMIADINVNSQYVPAIILMTDGQSRGSFKKFQKRWKKLGLDVPVFSIMFGKAEPSQLQQIAELTRGRVFDGRGDLVKAFRTAKGYN